MLSVKRYINGTQIEYKDLKNVVIDSSLIRHIIADVNGRLRFLSRQKREEGITNVTKAEARGA